MKTYQVAFSAEWGAPSDFFLTAISEAAISIPSCLMCKRSHQWPADENSLTLVTCFSFYYVGAATERFIVRARQVARVGGG